MFKKRKQKIAEDVAEQRFDDMMDLVKNLSRQDYNRLKQAMDLGYEAYQKVKNVKSDDEKEVEDINQIDKQMTKEREVKNAKGNTTRSTKEN